MKTIKFANGVRMTFNGKTTEYVDMTVFDVIKCTDEQRIEIIRNLMGLHRIDFRPMGYDMILELY